MSLRQSIRDAMSRMRQGRRESRPTLQEVMALIESHDPRGMPGPPGPTGLTGATGAPGPGVAPASPAPAASSPPTIFVEPTGPSMHPSYMIDEDYAALLAQFDGAHHFTADNGERMGVVSDYLRDRGFEVHADGWDWLRKWDRWPGLSPNGTGLSWDWKQTLWWKAESAAMPWSMSAGPASVPGQAWLHLRDALHVAVCWYAETMADLDPR